MSQERMLLSRDWACAGAAAAYMLPLLGGLGGGVVFLGGGVWAWIQARGQQLDVDLGDLIAAAGVLAVLPIALGLFLLQRITKLGDNFHRHEGWVEAKLDVIGRDIQELKEVAHEPER